MHQWYPHTTRDDEDRSIKAVGHARTRRGREGLTDRQRLAGRICHRQDIRVKPVGREEIILHATQAGRGDITWWPC
jgi:hypothetical protein